MAIFKTSDTSHYGKDGPWELPEGWVWTTLGTVCHIAGRIGFRGYTKADLVKENGAITLSPSNIIDGKMNFSHYTMISWEKYNESPEIQVNVGDILLVKTGSSYGKAALVDILPLQSTINPQFVVLKHILCDSYFLIHLLQSGYAKKLYDAFVLGTAIPTFTQAALNEMLIPLPPLSEQRRIVTAINKWNNHISQVDKAEHDLQIIVDTCKAKVLDLATHGKLVSQDPSDEPAIELLRRIKPDFTPSHNLHYTGVIPNGWLLLTYNDVADYINGRAFKPEEWESDGMPIIRIQNLNEPCAPYNYSSGSFEKQYHVQKGDLLFAWAASLGVYFWKGQDAWLNQHIFKVNPFSYIDKEYLYFALSASINDFYQKSHGSGMVHITRKQFVSMPLLLPPINEQKRIIKAVKAYYNVLDEIAAGLN